MDRFNATLRRARSKARHARAVCAEVKTERAHKRDMARAKAARREERDAEWTLDQLAGAALI